MNTKNIIENDDQSSSQTLQLVKVIHHNYIEMNYNIYLQNQTYFELIMLFIVKIIVSFIKNYFKIFKIDPQFQSSLFIMLIHVQLGICINPKCYEKLLKKYILLQNKHEKLNESKQYSLNHLELKIKQNKDEIFYSNRNPTQKTIKRLQRLSIQTCNIKNKEQQNFYSLEAFKFKLKHNLYVQPLNFNKNLTKNIKNKSIHLQKSVKSEINTLKRYKYKIKEQIVSNQLSSSFMTQKKHELTKNNMNIKILKKKQIQNVKYCLKIDNNKQSEIKQNTIETNKIYQENNNCNKKNIKEWKNIIKQLQLSRKKMKKTRQNQYIGCNNYDNYQNKNAKVSKNNEENILQIERNTNEYLKEDNQINLAVFQQNQVIGSQRLELQQKIKMQPRNKIRKINSNRLKIQKNNFHQECIKRNKIFQIDDFNCNQIT